MLILIFFGGFEVFSATNLFAQDQQKAETLYQQARQAMSMGDADRALQLCGEATQADKAYAPAWQLRGMLFADKRSHEDAVNAFTKAIELLPADADGYDRRGSEHLLSGKFQEAIMDFDKAIELDPTRHRRHWKRGIACYYAKEYAAGAEQFALYQSYDDNDVENSVWRYLCMAKDPEAGLDEARRELLPIERDRRVPLMAVFAMFRGEASAGDVLDAVDEGEPNADEIKRREFYAHLYLGIYYDAQGDGIKAKKHMDKAVARQQPGYMWDIAKVHAEYLKSQDCVQDCRQEGQGSRECPGCHP